jgi:hypothetical protein
MFAYDSLNKNSWWLSLWGNPAQQRKVQAGARCKVQGMNGKPHFLPRMCTAAEIVMVCDPSLFAFG